MLGQSMCVWDFQTGCTIYIPTTHLWEIEWHSFDNTWHFSFFCSSLFYPFWWAYCQASDFENIGSDVFGSPLSGLTVPVSPWGLTWGQPTCLCHLPCSERHLTLKTLTCTLSSNAKNKYIIIPILLKQKLNKWPKVTQQESDKITGHQRLDLCTCIPFPRGLISLWQGKVGRKQHTLL